MPLLEPLIICVRLERKSFVKMTFFHCLFRHDYGIAKISFQIGIMRSSMLYSLFSTLDVGQNKIEESEW
jgi:type III secretory pathway component EscR